ncbi:MAG: trigger factor [Deltaproteobacteria bacterium]|nr:trigger factor [Deltaproteobacteria bacterium]
MKVEVENVNTVKKVLHVEIPEEDVSRELEKAYRALKKNAKIKGFRPGKVPRSILERRFKKDVYTDVSGQLIQNCFFDALREAKLDPVCEPTINRPDIQEGKPYRYSATVEVRPSIGNLKLKGLKLKQEVHTVTDNEIEAQLKILQKRQAQLKTIDENRSVKNGDFVLIDYEGFRNNKPFAPAGKTENFLLQVGAGQVLEDFDQQLLGMEPGTTKEFPVRFPDDYYNKDLAGFQVIFKVSLKEIKEEILPEIDDEFAKDLGEYQTLAELKEAIRKDIQNKYDAQSKYQLGQRIVDALIDQCDFELPEGLVQQELSAMVRNAREAMAYKGIPLKQSGLRENELRKKYRPLAERRVREHFLLQKVCEQEEITLTDEILDAAYKELAADIGQPVEAIKRFHQAHADAYEAFRERTLEDQAIKWIIENNTIERIEANKKGSEPVKEADSTGVRP